MGGFYGSVQVRTVDRDKVLRAADDAARVFGIRFLVGPAINGWVGVYPEHAGQDQRIGASVARRAGGTALHAIVHDDDVFAYWLFQDGQPIDAFWSAPGYFGPEDHDAQLAMAGNPEAFGSLIGDRAEALQKLLRRDEHAGITFEAQRLEQFGGLLNIRNLVTSYEILKAGETIGIERFEEFVELPAEKVAAEVAARRERQRLIEEKKAELKRAWVLLSDVVEDRLLPRACTTPDGFLVAWEGHGRADVRVEHYRPPWGEPEPGEIETGGQINAVASDAAGRHVAMALGHRVTVWKTRGWKPELELVEDDWATNACLSPDGKLLAYATRAGVYVSEIASGKRVTALGAREGSTLAFHPSGEWLICAGAAVWIARVDGTEPWREMYLGGRAALGPEVSQAVQRQMAQVDLDAMEKKWRDTIEQAVQKMAKPGQTVPAELLARMREQMEKQLEQMRANFMKLKAGQIPPPRRGNETAAGAGFTHSGRLLWCGTDKGLRIYEWKKVVESEGDAMPAPAWSYPAEGAAPVGYVYAAVAEAGGKALLFGGYAGTVHRLDFTTGAVRDLVTPPDGGAIVCLTMAHDGSALGVCSRPALGHGPQDPQDNRAVWQIWAYPALLEKAPS